MKFRRDTTTLFLDPASKEQLIYDTSKKVNIILSPSLYWVKKMSLPVTNVREVKKLLPSIFEDSLPVGHYSYTAYKHGEDFMLFAYEDKKNTRLTRTTWHFICKYNIYTFCSK
jgi:hypothetical protein